MAYMETDLNTNDKSSTARIYEIGFLFVPTIKEEALASDVSSMKDALSKQGAVFISEEFPRMIDLAYTMDRIVEHKRQKYDSAYFGWVKFEADPSVLDTIKKSLESNEKIIRFLIIKTVRENTIFRRQSQKHNTDSKSRVSVSNDEGNTEELDATASTAEVDKQIDALVIE